MPRDARVPVSVRALLQRINRRLVKDDTMVKATRGDRWRHELGDFYTVNIKRNAIIEKAVDLEALGRKMKALQRYERLVTEEEGR